MPADPDFWQVVLRIVARRARSKPHRYALCGANHRLETRMITRRRASTGLDKNREKRRIPMARWAKSGPSGDHRNSHHPRNPATAGPSRAEKSPEHVRALVFWWRRAGSNRRPIDCEPIALPTELRPHEPAQILRVTMVSVNCTGEFAQTKRACAMASPFLLSGDVTSSSWSWRQQPWP